MTDYLPLIIGMMIVTYLPRLLPLITLSKCPLPPLLRRFFLYIPYTALGVLIMRGIVETTSSMILATFIGIGVAGICSWLGGGLIASVAFSIIAAFFTLSSGG